MHGCKNARTNARGQVLYHCLIAQDLTLRLTVAEGIAYMGTRFLFAGVVITILLASAGCASVNTVRFFEPSLSTSSWDTIKAADGIAFFSRGVCVYVSDANKDIQVQALGPIGLPIIPTGLLDQKHPRSFFEMALWFVPGMDQLAFSFDPAQLQIVFDDGSAKTANVVQVSRFKTRVIKNEERIYYPEHWGAKPLKDFTEPVELWDWSRFIIRFEKPSESATPMLVRTRGLLRNGARHELPDIAFSPASDTRYAFPGRFADGVSISELNSIPWQPCRKLEQNR